MSETNDFKEHPNWCSREDAVERLDQHFKARSNEQGSFGESTLLLRRPVVVTDVVDERLGETIESEALDLLHEQKDSGAAVVMVPDSLEGILPALCEALRVIFPVNPDNRYEFQMPFSWVPALRRSIEETHSENEYRYLLIDQFQNVLAAPEREQRIFGRVLQQLAQLKQCMVIVGVNDEFSEESAELLGFIEAGDSEEVTPLKRYEVRQSMEIVKVNTEDYRKKRRAAAAGVALAGCITGAALVGLWEHQFSGKNEAVTQSLAVNTPSAVITPINPQGQVLEPIKFELPDLEKTLDAAEIPVPGTPSETGPDPEIGNGQPTDPKSAEDRDAVRAEKLYLVGEAFCFGNGVDQDIESGLNYLNQAYNLGNEKAANLLATCYSKGFGVVQSHERAFQLYEEAVDRGDRYAYGNLGVHYLRGWGCDFNAEKARQFFEKGAEKGDSVAALYLAKCLEKGVGNKGVPDNELAHDWFVEAAELGNPEAIEWCKENGVDLQH